MKKFKKIYVEITNMCNLNCPFCSKDNLKKKQMSLDEFEMVLQKIDKYTDYLYLHIKGEPLLHKEFKDILKLCKKYNKQVNITTNGTLLKQRLDDIIASNVVRQVNISLQSLVSLNYLNDVVESVKELSSNGIEIVYRIWLDTPLKTKILTTLEQEYNITNLEDELKQKRNLTLIRHVYLNSDDEFTWPSLDNAFVGIKGTCYGTRTHIGILASGEVVPCCLDSKGILTFGNIFVTSLEEILNNPQFVRMQEGFRNNKIIKELCQKCDFRTKL